MPYTLTENTPSGRQNLLYACLLITIIVALSSMPIPTTYAQAADLQVNPANIYIEANPPADPRASFTISNNSDRSVTLDLGYKLIDAKNSQDGKVTHVNNSSPSVQAFFRQVQVVDEENVTYNSIELGPKQQKTLQLRIILPKDQRESDYYFTLIFLQDQNNIDPNASDDDVSTQIATTSLASGIGINTFLAIGPKEEPQIAISDFSTGWLHQTGPIKFNLALRNLGLHYSKLEGQIIIKNLLGDTVGRIELPDRALLPGAERSILTEANTPITWNNWFLLGGYTAELQILNSRNEIVTAQSIRFAAIPLFLMIGIGIIIAGSIFVYRRVKKRI